MQYEKVNGIYCAIKKVENINVYVQLAIAESLGTPPIVKIDADTNTIYYQYIDGKSLRETIDAGVELSRPILTDLIYQLSQILSDLKKINIVHKDLKPENIIIDKENRVYLIDFGVSRIENFKDKDTSLFGTRGYASPEHYGYSSTTFKSDMFSLGRIIEEIDNENYYMKISSKCTEIDPINRYDSYEEIIKDLNLKLSKLEKSQQFFTNKEDKISIANHISLEIAIIYAVLAVFLTAIALKNLPSFSVADILISIYVVFFLIDTVDYIRTVIKVVFKKETLKFLLFKLLLSLSVFIVLIFLYVIFS